ncbi:hypothetical protein AB4Z55_27395 [Gordonia sp. ABKF26]|uniref:hypothetical protein n=1 Tax=Gordonia sp. ABKF26 TaxID=3238687 RepID=UPI0034E4FFF8
MADLFYPDPEGRENDGASVAPRLRRIVSIHTETIDYINRRSAYPRTTEFLADQEEWEKYPHRDLPADESAEALRSLLAAGNDRVADAGLEQTEDDRLVHYMLVDAYQDVFQDVGGIVVIGEEAPDTAYAIWRQLPIGQMYIVLDAIDGTLPRQVSGEGASINASIYLRAGEIVADIAHDTLLATVTTKTSGTHLIGQHPGSTFVAHRDGPIVRLSEFGVRADQVRLGSVAVVAAQGHHREGPAAVLLDTIVRGWNLPATRSGSRVITDPSLTVFTGGGAPALFAYAAGHLETVVFPKPQTVHDVTGIVHTAALGGHIFLLGGEEIGLDELRYWCQTVAHPKSKAYRPVPALLLSRDETRGRIIAERMGEAGPWTQLMAVDMGEPDSRPVMPPVTDEKWDNNESHDDDDEGAW